MTAIVLRGDAAHLPLPDGSVDLIVTSPPYWNLRSYTDGGGLHYDGQIGSEATPAEFVAALIDCTREWTRVLKPGGSLFVNLGDKYSTGNSGQSGLAKLGEQWAGGGHSDGKAKQRSAAVPGMPTKCLLGLPWRYALGCIDQLGLILRAEIVWAKPNGLPESVTDRVRRSHEQVFHFTRLPRYFAAVDEIREPHEGSHGGPGCSGMTAGSYTRVRGDGALGRSTLALNPLGKLPGSVWTIPSAPLTVPPHLGVDHFAAFPPALVRPIVLGWSPAGICTRCGEGRRPVSMAGTFEAKPFAAAQQASGRTWHGGNPATRSLGIAAGERQRTITGYACACGIWEESCNPSTNPASSTLTANAPDGHTITATTTPPPTRPAIVLDPFGGTGTTALVASVYGRHAITVDMSADYCRLAAWRTRDPAERARAMDVPKPPPVPDGMEPLFSM